MQVNHSVEFTIDLSVKERQALERLMGLPCAVEKKATLIVRVGVELQEKLPTKPEAPKP